MTLTDLTYCPTCNLAMYTRENIICSRSARLVSRDADGTARIRLTGAVEFDEGDAALGCLDESHAWAMNCVVENSNVSVG